MRILTKLMCASAWGVCALSNASGELALKQGATLLFYGNSLVERLCEQGGMEANLQLAHPGLQLRLRSLAWTGDEVGNRWRAEGYAEHLKNLIERWPAQVVVVGFGMNEAFGGPEGVSAFQAQWEVFLRQLQRLHPGAQVVLLAPTAMEVASAPKGLDVAARNRDLELYAAVIRELAKARGLGFVDLYGKSLAAYGSSELPLTSNGLHLNELGCGLMGRVVAAALAGENALGRVDTARLSEIVPAAARKARYVADVVRPKNGVVYYGVRKRPDEYAGEMPRYHQLIEQAELDLHELVGTPGKTFASVPIPTLPPMPEGKSRPDAVLGVIKPAAEQQQEMTVAEGFKLNLFASDEQFPDLRNPVQMAFDARGRLWVVSMPTWPHTVPGALPEDKILVLEDTDRDGRADKCTVFAEGFDALDGIAFHEQGVVVSAQPRLLLLRDTDGDGRADEQREILRGVDVTDSHHGGMINTDALGHISLCDGVFHRSQFETPFGPHRGIDSTTYRFDPRSGRLWTEWQSTTPNPWKMCYDREGSAFQMYGDGIVQDGLQMTRTPLGAYHPFGHGKVLGYGKGSGAASISSPNFPDAYQHGMASATLLGRYFVAISRLNCESGPYAATDRVDVLRSENPAFRPVDLGFGMDGALYVSDFASKIIGHAQHPMRDPLWNHDRGRIWRVVSTAKPVVTDWPQIEGAPVEALLSLLRHPQDLVRNHVRIELRKLGASALAPLRDWVGTLDRSVADFGQSALEALWVLESMGEAQAPLLREVLASGDPAVRVAGVQLLRFQADRLPDVAVTLERMLKDPHPRVRMAVVNVAAFLRTEQPALEHLFHGVSDRSPAVTRMVKDLALGTRPLKGRSVPVLEMAQECRLPVWQSNRPDGEVFDSAGGKAPLGGSNGTWRTLVRAELAQSAMLSVKHGYLDIAVNGVQLVSSDSMWSSQQQAQFELAKGLNRLEVTFRNLKAGMPAVYLSSLLGERLEGVASAGDAASLGELAAAWESAHAADADALRVQAVPNQMQFAPKEIRVKAGKMVRVVFENPDLMLHNFVLLRPGSGEEVGALADQMAAQADAAAREYVPDSPKVLHATGLVQPGARAELKFKAPGTPGRYPYLCTFPGHWRIMQGEMIVE
jgi:azurin/lysophospholipase L1-like esterase